MGHALPMPVVVRTRRYDEEFFQAMTDEPQLGPHRPEHLANRLDELFD